VKLNEDKIKSHPERVSNYKKVENQNNISINVFGYENKISFMHFQKSG